MTFTGLGDFYRSDEWRRCRDAFIGERLLRDGELRCERCGKAIVHPYEAILHHEDELDEAKVLDPSIALNPDNLMLVCHWCHDAIHERWGHQRSRHVYLVWGCPCSGKRAFVDSSRGKHDIVVDIDAIFDSLGGDRASVKSEALAMYRTAVDLIKTRGGRWRNAWIIRTLSRSSDRERLQRDLGGAEEVHVERSPEECRAEAERRGGEWPAWVEQWLLDASRFYYGRIPTDGRRRGFSKHPSLSRRPFKSVEGVPAGGGRFTPYTIVTMNEGSDTERRKDQLNRKTAIRCVEGMARGDSLTSVWGGMDVELIGLKGERMVDSSYTKADRFYLAWRDDRRISVRGFPTKEEAEAARSGLRGDVESTIRAIGAPLEWFGQMAEAGSGKSGKARERVNHG